MKKIDKRIKKMVYKIEDDILILSTDGTSNCGYPNDSINHYNKSKLELIEEEFILNSNLEGSGGRVTFKFKILKRFNKTKILLNSYKPLKRGKLEIDTYKIEINDSCLSSMFSKDKVE